VGRRSVSIQVDKSNLITNLLVCGDDTSVEQLAQETRLSAAYIQRILPCGMLSPKVIEAILSGGQRPHLTLAELLYQFPITWREQERKLLPTI